jgi:hypothetical protein
LVENINYKYENKKCDLVNVNLNNFIGNINIQTRTKCFNGWNKKGFSNHVGKIVGMKRALFNLYAEQNIEFKVYVV